MKLDTLYEEQDKDKIALIYLFQNEELTSTDAEVRESYYNISGFEHRYDGQNEIYDPYQMYLSYLYQKWPETSSWGKYYPEDSYTKPKIVDFIINTKLQSDGGAGIRVDYKILEEIIDTDIVLHIALVEDGISNTFENGSLGEKIPICNNVLRKMAPDGNGTLLGSLEIGDTGSVFVTIDKIRGTVSNYDNTRLIVYFQSKDGFKIYETERLNQHPFQDYGTWGETNIDNITKDKVASVRVNVSDGLLKFSKAFDEQSIIKIFNITGRQVFTYSVNCGENSFTLPTLSKGLYTISINNRKLKRNKIVITQ